MREALRAWQKSLSSALVHVLQTDEKRRLPRHGVPRAFEHHAKHLQVGRQIGARRQEIPQLVAAVDRLKMLPEQRLNRS